MQMNEYGFEHHITNHMYHHETSTKQSIDALIKGEDATTWTTSLSNEFGRLTQGVGKVDHQKNMSKVVTPYLSY